MEGWIKIHRRIKEHWIWDNPAYLKAWIAILMTVNHENKTVLIQGELIECNRGQSVLSLEGWVKCFGKGWTLQRVRTFLELLKRDQMIVTEGLRKTTRLTVCKYDEYQFEQQTKNRQRTDKQQAANRQVTTNKNEEEGEECKEGKQLTWRDDFSIYLDECEKAYKTFLEDKELMRDQSRLNPGINVPLSIEKGFKNYWSTQSAWKHKKRSKTQEIDWEMTIKNSIGINKVYFKKGEEPEEPHITRINSPDTNDIR